MIHRFSRHAGVTLIELLIYVAVLMIVIGMILPFLFRASEDRLLQQSMSVVEQNGDQALRSMVLRIGNAERILSPSPGQSASVLVLQSASGSLNPTIFGFTGGQLTMIEHTTLQTITSTQVALLDFKVTNTSTSTSRQSVLIGFHLSRSTRLSQPHYYSQYFETSAQLLPADKPVGNACGCIAPYCAGGNVYDWQVCEAGACRSAFTSLTCP